MSFRPSADLPQLLQVRQATRDNLNMTARKKHGPNMVSKTPQSLVGTGNTRTTHNQVPTDYVEIQQNEIAVLQSIYMEDFEEVKVKPAAWSVRDHHLIFYVNHLNVFPEIPRSRFQTATEGSLEPGHHDNHICAASNDVS
jgi:hypothetical protein